MQADQVLGPQLSAIGYIPKFVYWGGGTPSRLDSDEMLEIVTALHDSFDLSQIEEHAMETSPETLSITKLEAMRSLGVNRISMGIQSFDDKELRRAARGHSARQAERAVQMIHQAGFMNLNLDLIVAFPDQELETIESTFSKTVELNPKHITVYIYRAVPQTVMAKQIESGHRKDCSLKETFNHYNLSKLLLEEAGYFEYTLGYFAKHPDDKFKSEEYYFSMKGDYVGFGSGARSILGHHYLSNSSGNLHGFVEHPTEFSYHEKFSASRVESTFPLLRLTMLTEEGINFADFKRLFGFDFSEARSHSSFKGLMSYYNDCGTDFIETKENLYVTEETRRISYITSLLRAYAPLGDRKSKMEEAFSLLK